MRAAVAWPLVAALAEASAAAVVSLAAAIGLRALSPAASRLAGAVSLIALLPLCRAVLEGAGPLRATGAVAAALLPLFVLAAERLPAGQWATARRLGAGPALVFRRLVAPLLLPFLLAGIAAGTVLLGLAGRPHPPRAPLFLSYPPSLAG